MGKLGRALESQLHKDEQLRELLSYCRSAARGNRSDTDLEASGAGTAYDDVADKLAAILDGEQ